MLFIPARRGWQVLHLVDQLLEMLLSTIAIIVVIVVSTSTSFSGIVRVSGSRLRFVRATAPVAPGDHARETTFIRVCFTFRGVYFLRLSLLVAGCIVGLSGRLLRMAYESRSGIFATSH